MKNVLWVFAGLVATTAASAQSSLTLSGRIDAGFRNHTQTTNDVRTGVGNVGLEQNSNGLSGSRWILRGNEDLGDGWRALFHLEQGFFIDTGAYAHTPPAAFGRAAYVGLGNSYGTVTLGFQYTMLDYLLGFHDAQSVSTNSAMFYAYNGGAVCANGATTDGGGAGVCAGRIANSMIYGTPIVNGLRAWVMYAPGEDKNSTIGKRASDYWGSFIHYDSGQAAAGIGWQRLRTSDVTQPSGFRSTTTWAVSGSHSLSFGRLFAGLEKGTISTSSASDVGWSLGLTAPVGPLNMAIGYSFERTTDAAGARGGNRAFAGQLSYPLSRRTQLYGYFLSGKSDVTAGNMANAVTATGLPAGVLTALTGFAVGTVKNHWLGVGIRHDF